MQKTRDWLKDEVFFEIQKDMMKILTVSGESGSGKSNLVIQIAREYSKISGTPFSPAKNLCYTREQLEKLVYKLPPYSVIWLDEGAEAGFARTSMYGSQIELMQMFFTVRKFNNFIIWCIPKFRRLDKIFREDHVNYWIDVRFKDRKTMERGKFYLSKKGKYNQFIDDCWNLKDIEAHEEYNLKGWDSFTKTPKKVWDQYLGYKDQFLQDRLEKGSVDIEGKYIHVANRTWGVSDRQIAEDVESSESSINRKKLKYEKTIGWVKAES